MDYPAELTAGRPIGAALLLLLALLAVDVAFVAIHTYLSAHGSLERMWNVRVDGSIPELWQYLKWALTIGLLALAFRRNPALPYLALILLFAYFLLDDSRQIHEDAGAWLVGAFGIQPALGLRAQDFGELAATAIAGSVLIGLLLVTCLTSRNETARRFTRQMCLLVLALAFFGVGIDMADIAVPVPIVRRVLGVVEDAGEMMVASAMVAFAYWHLHTLPQPVQRKA